MAALDVEPPCDAGAPESRVLTTTDIARLRGWSTVHAWRWLTTQEKKYGPPFIIRVGPNRAIRITLEGLRRIEAEVGSSHLDPVRLAHEIKRHERLIKDADKRVDGLAHQAIEDRRRIRHLETQLAALQKKRLT